MTKNNLAKYKQFVTKKLLHHFNGEIVGEIQIAYKISKPVLSAKDRKTPIWDFDLRGSKWEDGRSRKINTPENVDYYCLLGLENNKPSKVFFVPADDLDVAHIRIPLSGNSKYIKYVI